MTTTTNVEQVKLNVMTNSQYNTATKNTNELYMVTDATTDYNDLSNKPDLSVYAQDADVVHKTGDETINGLKTISNYGLDFLNTSVTKGVDPGGYKYWAMRINANNGSSSWADNRLGVWETRLDADGNTNMYFGVYKNEAGSVASSMIQCIYNKSGNYGYATAPASDVNGSIVTTVNKSKAANGYFKLGNGLIVQWGSLNGETNTSGTINFPTAFSSTYFRVVAVSNKQGVSVSISQESTTGCTWTKNNTSAYIKWIAIGY